MSTVFNSNPLSIKVSEDVVVRPIFVPDDSDNTPVVDKVFISTGGQNVSEIFLTPGQTVTFYVTAFDSKGNSITQASSMVWDTAVAAVADYTEKGANFTNGVSFAIVQAKANGITQINAAINNVVSNTITIKVGTPSVQITPATSTIQKNTNVQLSAAYFGESGAVDTSKVIAWSVDSPQTATITQTGLVTGLNVGTVTVRAESNGVSSTATVVVEQPLPATLEIIPQSSLIFIGSDRQFQAVVKDSSGNILPNRIIEWKTEDDDVVLLGANLRFGLAGTVTSPTVKITGLKEGRATVRATDITSGISSANTVSAEASIIVERRPYNVRVSPSSPTILVDNKITLNAEAIEDTGASKAYPIDRWESLNPSVATVNSSGEVTGVTVGQASIRAVIGDKSGTAVVTVAEQPDPELQAIQVNPKTKTIGINEFTNLAATVTNIAGFVVSRQITWASATPSVATVDAFGRVTGVSNGTVTIRATVTKNDGTLLSDTATVTVFTAPPVDVASISVTPKASSTLVGQTANLSATILGTDNQILTRTVQWSSSNPAIATVSSTGVVTGVALGTTTITATVAKNNNSVISDTATVTVSVEDSPPQQWRDCASGLLNNGTPPAGYVQTTYLGAGGGFCWEPPATVGFSPALSTALNFTYQRGSSAYPETKTVVATNSSYSKSFRVTLRTNDSIKLSAGSGFSNGTLSFTLPPRQQRTFTITVTPELLEVLGDGNTTLELSVLVEDA